MSKVGRPRNKGGTVASILRRDRKCWLCRRGVAAADASRDHVEARSLGGYNKARNYRLAHQRCNSARGAVPPDLVVRVLAVLPPGASSEVICQALRRASGAWERGGQAAVLRLATVESPT